MAIHGKKADGSITHLPTPARYTLSQMRESMREESVPQTTPAAYDEVYQALRPLLFSLAYRMIGSVGEAEDTVQEAFLRYHRALAEGTEIAAPKAFLTTVATRLAIDAVRSARARHEAYVGVWL